jgi:hypothetical protein
LKWFSSTSWLLIVGLLVVAPMETESGPMGS